MNFDSLAKWLGWSFACMSAGLIACGCMFLGGYWRFFQINFLDYITIEDVLARSLLDVFPVAALLLQMFLMGILISSLRRIRAWNLKLERRARERLKRRGRLERWFHDNQVPVTSFFLAALMGWAVYATHKDAALACIMAFPFILGVLGVMISWFISPKTHEMRAWGIAVFLTFVPSLCCLRGYDIAQKRALGAKPDSSVYEWTIDKEDGEEIPSPADYIYAGRMGGYVFFARKGYHATMVIPESRLRMLKIFVPKATEPQEQPSS